MRNNPVGTLFDLPHALEKALGRRVVLDFDAEQGSTSYGDEIDLSYGHPIPAVPGLTALVKYASYDADTAVLRGNVANVDTDKLWLQMQYIY